MKRITKSIKNEGRGSFKGGGGGSIHQTFPSRPEEAKAPDKRIKYAALKDLRRHVIHWEGPEEVWPRATKKIQIWKYMYNNQCWYDTVICNKCGRTSRLCNVTIRT